MQDTTFTSTTDRAPFRRQSGMIGGVASGLAHTFDLDVSVLRVAMAVGLVFTGPLMFIAYLVAWLVVPIDPLVPVADRPSSAPALLVGAVAVILGLSIVVEVFSSLPLSWIIIGGFVAYYFWKR